MLLFFYVHVYNHSTCSGHTANAFLFACVFLFVNITSVVLAALSSCHSPKADATANLLPHIWYAIGGACWLCWHDYICQKVEFFLIWKEPQLAKWQCLTLQCLLLFFLQHCWHKGCRQNMNKEYNKKHFKMLPCIVKLVLPCQWNEKLTWKEEAHYDYIGGCGKVSLTKPSMRTHRA